MGAIEGVLSVELQMFVALKQKAQFPVQHAEDEQQLANQVSGWPVVDKC